MLSLDVLSGSLTAVEMLTDISLPLVIGLMQALAGFNLIGAYGSGINNVFDIEIDKINKPYTPIVSGKMLLKVGIALVCSFALMGFATAYFTGSKPLLCGISIHFIFGIIYSVNLPLLRWKNSAFGAAFSIVLVAISIYFSAYFHIQAFVFQRAFRFSRTFVFGAIVALIFGITISLSKDIPDIVGDKKYGVKSLAIIIGQKQVFWICVYLIELTYVSAIVFCATSSLLWSKLLTVSGHAIMAVILWKKAKSVDCTNAEEMLSFYLFLWKLKYAEHLLIPFVR